MTSLACRRFRAAFTPGSRHAHRERCPRCAAYAAALETAAGLRLPLPASLERRLLAIPAQEVPAAQPVAGASGQLASPTALPSAAPRAAADPAPLPFPVPQLPLPEGLRGRLLDLPRQSKGAEGAEVAGGAGRPRPPAWVLSPRYAVAASYLAAVLLGVAFGDPSELGRRFALGVEQIIDRAESAGERRLGSLEQAAADRYRRTQEAVGAVKKSVEGLGDRLPEIPSGLVPALDRNEDEMQEENNAPARKPGRERRSR